MAKKNRTQLTNSPLKILADFLNFDFKKDDPAKLKGKCAAHMIAFVHWPREQEEVEKLQAEMQGELTAIVRPATTQRREEAYLLLEALVRKINTMGLNPEWNVEAVDYETGGYIDPKTGKYEVELHEKSARHKSEVSKLLGYRQRVFTLLGFKWIVSTRILGAAVTSLRKSLYGIVIDALESGELVGLRRCLNCQVFFVAEDLKRKYCTLICTKAADQKNAALKRVPEWRKQQKRKELAQAKEAKEKQAFRKFSTFMKHAINGNVRQQEKISPITKKLGKGDLPRDKGDLQRGWQKIKLWKKKLGSGKTIEDIWEEMRQNDKKVFRERN
jgi:hypothetical protein